MKQRYLVLMLMGLLLVTTACREEDQVSASVVPEAVKKAFVQQFPNATDIEYEQEGEYYVVEFEKGEVDMEVVFDTTGKVMETETELDPTELPQDVSSYIQSNFAGAEIEEAEICVKDGITTFEVEIEIGDQSKELIFDEKGHFLQEEREEAEEDKD